MKFKDRLWKGHGIMCDKRRKKGHTESAFSSHRTKHTYKMCPFSYVFAYVRKKMERDKRDSGYEQSMLMWVEVGWVRYTCLNSAQNHGCGYLRCMLIKALTAKLETALTRDKRLQNRRCTACIVHCTYWHPTGIIQAELYKPAVIQLTSLMQMDTPSAELSAR